MRKCSILTVKIAQIRQNIWNFIVRKSNLQEMANFSDYPGDFRLQSGDLEKWFKIWSLQDCRGELAALPRRWRAKKKTRENLRIQPRWEGDGTWETGASSLSEEGGARTDRMECSSEYWVAREWDLDEEGMGSTKRWVWADKERGTSAMMSSIESTNCTQASERNRRPLIIAEKRDHLQRNSQNECRKRSHQIND